MRDERFVTTQRDGIPPLNHHKRASRTDPNTRNDLTNCIRKQYKNAQATDANAILADQSVQLLKIEDEAK